MSKKEKIVKPSGADHAALVRKGWLTEDGKTAMPFKTVQEIEEALPRNKKTGQKKKINGNGDLVFRKGLSFDRFYVIDKQRLNGGSKGLITAISLTPKIVIEEGNRDYIRKDILDYWRNSPSVISASKGGGAGGEIECDHKNGRKNDPRVMNAATQKKEDFQPLTRVENQNKRQACYDCVKSGKRPDATTLPCGFTKSYYAGGEDYVPGPNGCVGCYWYDPVAYHQSFKND